LAEIFSKALAREIGVAKIPIFPEQDLDVAALLWMKQNATRFAREIEQWDILSFRAKEERVALRPSEWKVKTTGTRIKRLKK
jgi:hypothetical protein